MSRFRNLLVDGILLALPLGAAAYLLYKAISLLKSLLVPVAHLLPAGHLLGVAAIEVAAIVVLLLVLAVLGVFARSPLGRSMGEGIEKVVLSKFPGYQVVKSIAADFSDSRDETVLRAALVSFDDNAVLGLIVEEPIAGDKYTVFVPGAPGSGAGSVMLVGRDRVQVLDAPASGVAKAMKQRGLGLQVLATEQSRT